MGKLMTDATGQQIVAAIQNIPAGSGGSGAGLNLPPSDGKTYVMRDGRWVEINAVTSSTATPSPTTETINQDGEVNVTFFLPWKFAQKATRTALNDVAHTAWRFPFAEGVIKKVSIMAKTPGGVKVDVLMDGSSVLGTEQTPTTAWTDYNVSVPVMQNQSLEIYVSEAILASDLTVSVTIEVGSNVIQFVGEPDVKPNVYVKGYRAMTWGADGQDSPDGQFRSIYMPEVSELRMAADGFAAKGVDGKWYICSNQKWPDLAPTTAPTTPVEMALENIDDISLQYASNSTLSYVAKMKNGGMRSNNSVLQNALNTKLKADSRFFPKTMYSVISADDTTVCFLNGANLVSAIVDDVKNVICYGNGQVFALSSNSIKVLNTSAAVTSIFNIPGKVIKKAFGFVSNIFFAVTEDNELYARGVSTNGCLGLSPTGGATSETRTDSGGAYYNEFTKVGVWDVKEIQSLNTVTFMLTNDGKLYHAGAATIIGPTQHNAFTQVFPNYRFHDIALPGLGAATQMNLVAIAEYLGEIAE